MPIRQAAQIHRIQLGLQASRLVATEVEYRRAHATAIQKAGGTLSVSVDQPRPYVEAWKWVVHCTTPDCDNRPMLGWGIACCFDCGAVYQGLVLPDDAPEIERLLGLRPKRSQQTWLLTETLGDLADQNLSIGVGV